MNVTAVTFVATCLPEIACYPFGYYIPSTGMDKSP